jgi:hypothetical protein
MMFCFQVHKHTAAGVHIHSSSAWLCTHLWNKLQLRMWCFGDVVSVDIHS